MKRFLMLFLILNIAQGFVASGKATLTSKGGLNHIGFNFLNSSVTGIDGDFYYFQGKLWTNGPYGIKLMDGDVNSCDLTGYLKEVPAHNDAYYCIKANDGSYAKIHITSLSPDTITIKWYHQRDGTNLFKTAPKEKEVNINWILIGIIILLLVIIIILWKR